MGFVCFCKGPRKGGRGDRPGKRGGFCFGFELEGGLSEWVVGVVLGVVVDPVTG